MKMNYFVFGTNNMNAAVEFYDLIFKGGEMTKLNNEGRMTLWAGTDFFFALAEPFDGKQATAGNGTMVGFNVSASEVKRLHQLALSIGGTDEGKPSIRSDRFSAYVRDLDGNKICFFE
ncbi:glyoxalase [Psychromonas sp. psych-6C06]|uniref:VOC family protein n=1 Tax=Psychromonas sp. psych-6C06 TaxID=2058089 RepID=UPI000C34463D|nr:VOC family protein [Psychromonas sp. psych-6C06]PKF61586.1 glyoxalase [Psychromonas sp. psych-6C06]